MKKTIAPIDIKSLEDYAFSLVTGILSLKSLEAYHIFAYKQGLMSTDEEETSQTIIWETKRLIALYQKQLEFVTDRTETNIEQIVERMKDDFR